MEGQRFEGTIDDARALLGELDGIKHRTRSDYLETAWQWMVLWAVVCAGAAGSAFTPLAGWYWIAGAPIGLALTMVFCGRAEVRAGLRRKPWPSMGIGMGIGIVNGYISWRFDDAVIVVSIWVVLGLGFAALMALEKVPDGTSLFLGLTLLTIVAGVTAQDVYALYPVVALAFSVTLGWCALRSKRQAAA